MMVHTYPSLLKPQPLPGRKDQKPQKKSGLFGVSPLLPGPSYHRPAALFLACRSFSPQARALEEVEKNYLLVFAPEDEEPLFILLAVADGDRHTLGVFTVDTDGCGEELNLWRRRKGQSVTPQLRSLKYSTRNYNKVNEESSRP